MAGVEKAEGKRVRFRHEITGILMVAVGLFGLVSLHSTATGFLGEYVARFLRWFMGVGGDIPPAILVAGGVLVFRCKPVESLGRRVLGFILVLTALVVFAHLRSRLPSGMSFTWRVVRVDELSPRGMGALGSLFSYWGLRVFGVTGSYIFLTASFLIGTILLFDRGLKAMAVRTARSLAAGRPGSSPDPVVPRPSVGILGVLRRLHSTRMGGMARKEAAVMQVEKPELDPVPEVDKPRRKKGKEGKKGSAQSPDPAEVAAFSSNPVQLEAPGSTFELPSTALLSVPKYKKQPQHREPAEVKLLEETLASFGIEGKVLNVDHGPVITRYEVQPARGTKVSRIVSLADDIALTLAAPDVRIEAPVPGKPVVGIEVPNKESAPVYLREVLESEEFVSHPSKLALALGKDIVGKPVIADLRKLLHLLIAGATGSGKSVCLNAIIASILFKATPEEVKLVMIDPKRVELATFNDIPHLISPVVTDPKKAAVALRWAVGEMEQRYQLFATSGTRNIDAYNDLVQKESRKTSGEEEDASEAKPLPYIVVIIDELADLMLVAGADVEDSICRLAQMARAAGIYLIIATQRPSVDVITGLIKANIPSRIAFAVSSQVDSRTILDMSGAERLLGKGDMLFYPIGSNKAIRAQGAFISDNDVEELVAFWRSQATGEVSVNIVEEVKSGVADQDTDDELFVDAVRLVRDTGSASISMIQRRFRVGYARAARLVDMMEVHGIVGPYQGSKPREVLMTESEIDEFLENL